MKIGIVSDLSHGAELLRRAVMMDERHRVSWIANGEAQAVALCHEQMPDMVLLDPRAPQVDAARLARRLMAEAPCPILLVVPHVNEHTSAVFEALAAGALDVIEAPLDDDDGDLPRTAALLQARIDVLERRLRRDQSPPECRTATPPGDAHSPGLVAIGASAGGPAALATVLSDLPADLPAAVVAVVHVDAKFAPGLAHWLGLQSAWPVRLAREGDALRAGTVYLASTDGHLVLKRSGTLGYEQAAGNHLYQPSINLFFESVCRYWRGLAAGVQLSGIGSDGVQGLKAMRDKGWLTIAQDRATSAVYGMPKAAALTGAAADVLPVQEIAPRLRRAWSPS